MMSKNLYFKLMKEDLKSRLWAAALISLGFFFLFPVTAAFMAGGIADYESYAMGLYRYSKDMTRWLSFENGMTVFVMVVTSLICGMSSFSYLNSRSKVDFYHSIPVRREKLYLANFLNGILIPAIPYAISLAAAAVIGTANGVDGNVLWGTAAEAFGLHMTYYILMYATVVIAAMLTGNLVIGFLGTMVLTFWIPAVVQLMRAYFSVFFDTFVSSASDHLYEFGLRISPFMEYVFQTDAHRSGESMVGAVTAALAVSALLAVLGCFLYQKRPSEAAGKAMAFAVSRPVIRVIIVLLSAQYLGLFLWEIRNSLGWAVFGILCGAVISHCTIEVIYHFDFKKLFSNKAQLAGCIVASLAVLCVFHYDLTGYDRYLPKESQVKEAAVRVNVLNDWVSYGKVVSAEDGSWTWETEYRDDYMEEMHYPDAANVLEIAKAGIGQMEQAKEMRRKSQKRESAKEAVIVQSVDGPTSVFTAGVIGEIASEEENEPETWSNVLVRYTLDNGRKVYRKYNFPLERAWPQMSSLYSSKEYQEGTFPLMRRTADQVAAVYYKEGLDPIRIQELTAEDRQEFLSAYQKDFSEMTLDDMKREYPIGLIRFSSQAEEDAMSWWNYHRNLRDWDVSQYQYTYHNNLDNRDYYPVYASYERTLKLLQEHQIDAGSYFASMDVISIQVERHLDQYQWEHISIVDPEEITQLMENLAEQRRIYYNNLFLTEGVENDLSVIIMVDEDGETSHYSAYFPKGTVLDYVEERLAASRETYK